MMHFSRRTKRTVPNPVTKKRLGKFAPIDIHDREAPNPGVLALLAQWMSEGKYRKFLMAFSPRMRAELLRGEQEVLDHEPVLPKWEPNEAHLAAERRKKDVAGQQ